MGEDVGNGGEHDALNGRINVRAFFERILTERDKAEAERDKRFDERFESQKEAITTALATVTRETNKYEAAARETMKTHNDLIRQSRERDATYATKDDLGHATTDIQKLERFQAKIIGALAVATFISPLITAVIVYVITKGGSS